MTTFGRALLVSGPEGLLAERAVHDRVSAARREVSDVQVTTVTAAGLEGDQLAEITGASLFATHSVAVITDIGSLDPALVDAVVSLARDCPPEVALVLVHEGGNKGKGLLDKLKKLDLDTVAAVAPKPWELGSFVTHEARRARVGIDQAAAQALVDAVGSDLRALASAVAQLASDSPDDTISLPLVRRYFSGRAEVSSFSVADAVVNGDAAAAIERLRWALDVGVPPVLVTSALASGLRGVGRFLEVRGSGMRDADVAREVGVPPWKVKDLARQSRGWSSSGVAAALSAVTRADADVKGVAADADYALERVVLAVVRLRTDHDGG